MTTWWPLRKSARTMRFWSVERSLASSTMTWLWKHSSSAASKASAACLMSSLKSWTRARPARQKREMQ